MLSMIGAMAGWALADDGGRTAEPPRMERRTIGRNEQLEGGPGSRQTVLRDGPIDFTLFLPAPVTTPEPRLTVHFHTAAWFIVQEHVRRGATNPLACFQLGEGSTVYRRAFEDRERLARCLRLIEEWLGNETALNIRIASLELSSFSAGYGAIREILKSSNYVDRVSSVLLADSMYGSLETNSVESAPARTVRQPLKEHVEVWRPFAEAAIRGEKTFIITYSHVETTTYASSRECAEALVRRLDLDPAEVARDSNSASADPEFPLLRRVDAGRLHIWGYGGADAQAHLTHVRHLADIWRAGDRLKIR